MGQAIQFKKGPLAPCDKTARQLDLINEHLKKLEEVAEKLRKEVFKK